MNQIYHSIDDVIAAYQAKALTREQVTQWLAQRKAAAPGKPCAIELRDPAAGLSPHTPPLDKPTLVLPRLPAPVQSIPELDQPWEIDVIDHGDGVYALELRGQAQAWNAALAEQLQQAMQVVAARPDAHALLLHGPAGPQFLPAGGEQAFFDSGAVMLPLDCPLPVIAVLDGDTCGPAWMFAALCDFMLCAEEGSYRYAARISAAEQALLGARFRLGDAGAMLLTDTARSGRELKNAGLGLTVLPRSALNTAALALARQLAAAPQKALVLLKHHMAQELRTLTHAVLDAWRSEGPGARTVMHLPEGLQVGHPAPGWPLSLPSADANPGAASRQNVWHIDTGCAVVKLDIDASGVALLTLCDQRGSNAFSDELVSGVARAFDAVAGLAQARVLVLSGEGNYFSTGGTRASLLAIQTGRAQFTDIDIYSRAATLDIPVIAAIQGHGVGAGWALGMFSDIVVHSVQHSYCSPYMRYGFTPGAGATLAFAEKFGLDLAREILFCAGQYSGAELRARGVPGVFAAAGTVTAWALALAAQLAVMERATLEALKRHNGARIAQRRQAVFAQEQAMHAQCFVGNAEVLARINRHFDEGMAAAAPTQAETALPAALRTCGQEKQDTLLPELRAMLAEELFMEAADIDAQQKFIDIGLDSITGVNWVRKINNRYGLALNATAIYRHPTLHDFVQYVHEQAPAIAAPAPANAPAAMDAVPAQKICTIAAPVAVTKAAPEVAQGTEQAAPQPASGGRPKIAVIGMAGQFPKARDLAQFWRNLAEGRDCISKIPSERWSIERYVHSDPKQPGKSYSKWLGSLEDVALFDPLFFGISPREAEWMDPQQRVFLQNAWHCVEDAGYSPAALSGSRCGVFVGCTAGDYSQQIERIDLNAQNFMGRATSILAAKIAYLLNLQGPCLSIDTACSSSLVAMAAACDSLVSGASDMALAGGVCVLAGPDMHIMTSKAGMLSADGRCRTFDERANGFVPGEGVAVLMLKRLEDAERDGDAIHGVISGWGVNQDGKTNGMTAPNPQAQARLAQQVYRQFAIEPDTIDLVEAHGTGTRLGDPIEVEGLKEAFSAFGTRSGYCALGSVKSNIGHTLAAAGIAGAVKLLLALRHQLMPATLHVEQVNSHIALDGSPFFINSSARPWLRTTGKTRRAAVSSFGFSGTNAHMVIEEYIPFATDDVHAARPSVGGPHAVVLSARQAERLPLMARRLLDFLEQPQQQPIDLASVAYTLQVGREAMAARLALEVHTLDELRSALRSVVQGESFTSELSAPVAAWVAGAPLDWLAQYWKNARPQRLSLPGYPFELQRYWLPATADASAASQAPPVLHPLLHRQTSTLFSGQRYSSHFSGAEFFFAQHLIMDRPVLPGVGHLEMVRAAVHDACGGQLEGRLNVRRMQIKNVVWMRPVACAPHTTTVVHIALAQQEEGEISFSIFSDAADAAQPPIVHSQGVVVVGALDDAPAIDLAAVQARCRSVRPASHHFGTMRLRGADLGRAFRGISDYHLGASEQGVPQVLARITIPDGLDIAADRFLLHPTALDAAVHTAPPLMAGWEDAARSALALPFALDELQVLAGCRQEMWALAQPAAGAAPGALKYDIDLCDNAGAVCVRFKGFSFRVVDKAPAAQPQPSPAASPEPQLLMLAPVWTALASAASVIPQRTPAGQHVIVLCGFGDAGPAWRTRLGDTHIHILETRRQGAEGAADIAAQSLALVQNLVMARRADAAATRVFVQFVVATPADPMLAALVALARVLRREHPMIEAQVVLTDPADADITQQMQACAQHPSATLLRHSRRAGACETLEWRDLDLDRDLDTGLDLDLLKPEPAHIPWREGGVYLITGGAGALGLVFAREILARTKRLSLILCGRSPQDDSLLAQLGKRVAYSQVDLAQPQQATALASEIRQRHGRLDGVLHCAGVLRDSFIAHKTAEQLRAVFAAKVASLLNLETALTATGLEPDFMVLFSSIAAALGNAGQADYAMANAYLDSYAAQRNHRARTLSINWPLWQQGGMAPDAGSIRWMAANTGLAPMRTASGIEAFYRALASGLPQVMALQGDAAAIREFIAAPASDTHLAPDSAAAPSSLAVSPPTPEHTSMEPSPVITDLSRRIAEVDALLRPMVGAILKIAPNQLDADKELISYGFDSISLTELTNELNARFKIASRRALNPTVFFEQPTLRRFTAYLAAEYPELADASAAAPVLQPTAQQPAIPQQAIQRPAPVATPTPVAAPALAHSRTREPLAVVGISGRFPAARDVREYWRNLAAGRDCITEVPAERWNWRDVHGDPAQEGNRTDVRFGGFIEGVSEFDALFFGISPREALYMDPMQRLLMQHTWHAIEDAGYSARALSGTRTAIFVGTSVSEYGMLLQQAGVPCDAFLPTGRSPSLGANRMSYLLNITGPSETVDTACSSSLVAIHRAVQAIDSGQADMALVGGVNVLIAPDGHISFRKAGMLSEDGRCKTFSGAADGYARGEGAGMMFLKKLSDAERDGDHIYGLVRGSGENHGGRASSLTAPNPRAQADLIKTVCTESGVDPRSIGFIEAHGTGTPLGDPVEVNALKMAFRELYQASGDSRVTAAHCGIGSAKSNIGHLELAAGVAGAIKVLLQLKHRTLAKSLHSEPLNPYIDLRDTPFYVVQQTMPWPAPLDAAGNAGPRRAGVSSFGFGGANAHVLFEEYIAPATQAGGPVLRHDDGRARMIVLSARSEERLRAAAQQLLDAVTEDDAVSLDGVAGTLQVGREHFDERLAFMASSLAQLRTQLASFVGGSTDAALCRGKVARGDQVLSLFDGDELRETVSRWAVRGQYDKLLALWVKGGDIDWSMLQAQSGVALQRVSLPGYPFARERHWPATAPAGTIPAGTTAPPPPTVAAAARSIAYLKKSWTPAPVQPCEDIVTGQALILATDATMSLARLLAPQVNGMIVNLDDDYASHRAMETGFAGAIDLTGCAAQAPGPLVLLPWLQQLAAQRSPGLLLGVTRGLESFDNDSMNLAGAAVAGLYRMLHSEYARLRSRHLDLDARDDEATRARQIVNEWLSAGDDAQVSYRKGVRHTARLEEIAVPAATSPLAFDRASVLWISGGTRGIGLLCARHFVVQHQVRKLVLTGRQALPPEQEWDRYLASSTPQDAVLASKINAVRALREQGVQVEVLALADTALNMVAETVQRVVRSMGPIGGVLHCAGINDMETPAFVRKTSESFAAVLAPKVAGLDALLAAVRGQPLRFIALFSSVAATVPALAAGQSDYACANAYMDYVAEAHAAELPLLSIQWPSWKETGMGEAGTRAYRDSGMLSHTDAEGLHMLDTVLASRCGPVVLPAVVDRARWQPQRLMQRSLSNADAGLSAIPIPAEKAVMAAANGLGVATLGWLAQLFAKELMVAPDTLDPHTPFQDYGVDSIMLTQILRRVDTALAAHGKQQALDPSIFYEHPTLAAFSAYLGQACPAALQDLLGPSAQPQPQHAPQPQPPSQAPLQPQAQPAATPVNTVNDTDIAVIGMACSLPGAADLDAYWRLLAEGRSAIGPVPATRWQHNSDHYAGLIDNVDSFDARYFLLDERDASAMDPQALLLLEQTLAALHHAGYSAGDIKGSATGVYIGARSGHRPAAEMLRQARNPIVAVGQNYLAANISQFFDLQGPSLVLDTACSSALVAMHMALRALQGGEISAALVGGVSLLASDEAHRLFGSRKLLSAGGEFHLFDGRASGVVLGEGAGMVMLKPLQQALADGDRVQAVIKGLAINNDGRTAGPATPNLVAQKAVMRAALAASGVQPEQVGYIHANGSGSEVTDLLELKATEAVYRAQADAPCELGSVEPNIGHPLCAKGIAGFIAVVLMLAQRQRVPFLSGQHTMAHYDMARSPFRFGRALERWQDHAPYAALSCFADGGTNAHVILAPWEGGANERARRQPLPMPALQRRRISARGEAPAWPQCEVSGHLLLTAEHPIVRGHQAYGQQLLPGLAYIDIVFQHFERLGYTLQELELRNLSIYQPLIVSAGHDVLLDVRCLEQAGGHWQVELEGSAPAAGAAGPRQRYATAEVHLTAPAVFDARLDLPQLRREAASTLDLAQLYAQCSRQGLQHDGAIRAKGQVYETAQATYIEIEVGPDALADAGAYRFHPALIDGSSVGAQRLFAAFFEGEDRLILPLFYASFRAIKPLGTRCTARIAADTLRRKNELLYMDIEFFDMAGAKVAHLHNYACKLVRDEGAINPQRKSGAAPVPASMAASRHGDKAVCTVAVNDAATPSAAAAVEHYLAELMASRVGVPAVQIDTTLGYYELGLDSAKLLDLVRELEVRVGAALAPTLLFEYTTIAELAQYLAGQYPAAWKTDAGAAAPDAASATAAPAAAPLPPAATAASAGANVPPGSPVAMPVQDIAIIGMAGRYPGADDVEQFWEQLRTGADCVTEVPEARWEATRLAGITSPSGKPMSRWGGFINDADRFDAQFFRISPWEAKLLDPQQRQFLEVCWAAMEDAGYTPNNLVTPRGRHQRRHVGVYAGVMHNDYALLTADAIARGEAMPVSLNYAQIANRVSYFCNFHGPSMAIDTVCSSSLIAVHMAMESLRSGECEVALAGGVNLSLHPLKYMTYGMMDMHASDGRCRAFGQGGDGYVSAEGVGAVLLKPLSQAVRDNDHIYAVIKGSTTNHVGAVSGLTVPSPVAQADMIEQCLEKTCIDARTISYVEAHGTGTSLGDPIEIQGLTKAFGYFTSDKQYCAIGSVKSNIGHAESAAGISGLTKLALQLHHRTLVPSLHSAELNPFLDFANTPFYVQQVCEPWRQPTVTERGVEVAVPRRAALSSFGASGSNAHLILEEYVAPERTLPASAPLLVPLSAKSAERLQAVAKRLLAYLERHGDSVVLADLAYTLQTGRVAMTERAVCIASDIAALRIELAALAEHGQAALRATVAKNRPATAGEAVARSIAAGDLPALAQAWLQGDTIDWAALHARLLPHYPARRISLPHYPFARDRHWVDAPALQQAVPAPVSAPPAPAPAAAAADVVYFAPRWQEQSLFSSAAPGACKTTVFAIGAPADLIAPAGAQLMVLAASGDDAADIERHAGALLAWCQDSRRPRTEAELLLVYAPYHATGHPYRSLMGVLRTIALELPHIRTRLVLDSAIDEGNLPLMQARLRDEAGANDGYTEIAWPPGQPRQVLVQQTLDDLAPAGDAALAGVMRQHGVYLISGGLGGLGRMFASHIGQGAGARIVLTGRSPLDTARAEDLKRLRAQGVHAEYIVCDMARPEQVQALVDQVVTRHGALHGVIHGAGVLADNFIARTTVDDLHKVLAAKLAIVHLDRATSAMALDFFMAFSSAAALGNAGQFGYATANAFLDSFMGERTALVARGQRHGRSLSINWPLWQDGGMAMEPAHAQFMREQFGIVPLQQAPGIIAFAAALRSDEAQFGVFQGDTARIRALLTARPAIPAEAPPVPAPASTPSLDEDMVRAAVAQVLGMAPAALDDEVEFADYGMDSIGATRIAALLNGRLGLALGGAVFMELNSTAKLIAHLHQIVRPAAPASAPAPVPEPAILPTPLSPPLPIDEAPPATMAPAAPSGPQVAIVGMNTRLPGAADVDAYWENLQAKAISIDDAPGGHWQARGVSSVMQEDEEEYSSMRHAGLIDGVEFFDAAFWGMDEQAARAMDPQQRLLLRSIWHCVEDAGIAMQDLTRGRVGLFLALDALDYQTLAREQGVAPAQSLSTGMIANQISYLCNFTGPSEAVDNACASTYVALKRAVQALAAGECDSAIVGGAKILLDPAGFRSRDEGEILSRSGRMYPFDARADGYVRGEGVGCVLLKPTAQAIADGDTIHALVAGVGVTHNGRGALSPVAPSVDGQYQAIRAAYRMAGFGPDSVGYIEAHGTSNSFSDAAELAAFKQFFREQLAEGDYRHHRCAISSVKANIGHLEGASGIASLVKAVCALRDGRIAPIANWSQLHPSILLEHSPFYLPDSVTPWPRHGAVRRAGLHSIGIGGVNAHVLLEEYRPSSPPAAPSLVQGPQLVLLSARSPAALRQLCRRWRQHVAGVIEAAPDSAAAQAALNGLAHSSQVARDAMPYRAAYLVADIAELAAALALDVEQIAGKPFDSGTAYAAANLAGLVQGGTARERGAPLTPGLGMDGLRAAADAWLSGKPVDWRSGAIPAARVALPAYPFEERRYWLLDTVDRADPADPADPVDPFAVLFHATFASTPEDDTTVPA